MRQDVGFYTERVLASIAVAWGSWLLFLDATTVVPAYAGLAKHIPAPLLGGFFVVCGAALLLLPHQGWRRFVHVALVAGWIVISLSFVFDNWANTGAVVYAGLALLHAGMYWWQSDQSAGHADLHTDGL